MRRFLHVVPCLGLVVGCSGADPRESVIHGSERIVGGIVDPDHAYVVAISDGTLGIDGAFCSGTVISRRTVITAGHCYDATLGKNGGIGSVDFGTTADGSKRVAVSKAVQHPGYNDDTLANDITVLRLAEDSPVQPAPLLRETLGNSPDWIGPPFTFVGFGDTDEVKDLGFGTKRVVRMPLAFIGPKKVGGTIGSIDKTQVYYKVTGKNTCDGDSGGPMFAIRKGVERHAGVTSSGDETCEVDGTNARTDLPAIESFIQAQIDANEGTDPCRNDGVCDESCNTGANLVDPDCAENHCAQDGICALSCAAPVDPDCLTDPSTDLCIEDGLCNPSCAVADPDCAAGSAGAAGGGAAGSAGSGAAGASEAGSAGASPAGAAGSGATTAGAAGSGATGSAAAGAAGGQGGLAGGSGQTGGGQAGREPTGGLAGDPAASPRPDASGGGCSLPAGTPGGPGPLAVLAAALQLASLRRSRRR